MDYQNLKFLRDSFLNTQSICSWSITTDGQMLHSNCPEFEFFFNIFSVSSCCTAIQRHFSNSAAPYVTTDSIGFVWMAALQPADDTEQIPTIHMLGPVFTSEMTERYLSQHMRKLHLNSNLADRLWYFVKEVPTISSNMACCYASMLHYCVSGETVRPIDIEMWSEPAAHSEEVGWGDANWHGTWLSEQRMFKNISEGKIEDYSKMQNGRIGNIGGGDPLRQAKNEMIVFAVICSRAAIFGGVSSEGSLNISDHYVQKIEAAQTVSAVRNIGAEMHNTYIQRVRKAKESSDQSPLVRDCMEYVDTHIFKKISLKEMSQEIGYTEHYISRKFKSELGLSLFDYINQQKIAMGQVLLRETGLSIADISDRLGYSSPSYFSALFKKLTGVTPVEYQRNNREVP